ncbi:hypothetical protein VHEMI10211 [[Torrubiella] hemipterigena]|uniref:Haloacid dehalogenase n=1 Tax=[Torrubiella] hemipterigena TaxID=1531966 RepID=A0A0A1TIA4_9HYPO|nr:hypothetical protein VHEMI10211 [[Torrubiella] hemipterigena]
MSQSGASPLAGIKALTFDVFGTTVDWRSSVTDELILRAHRKLSPTAPTFPQQASGLPQNGSNLTAELRGRLAALTDDDWRRFAQEWRDSYGVFTNTFDRATSVWKSIDDHHRDSLRDLLAKWDLEGVYSESEIESLSLVWHRLTPWDDSADGLAALAAMSLTTATLSNGNLSLIQDLDDYGNLGFAKFFSAETFMAYKPDPSTYLGAAERMGLQPREVAMVAAHMTDLAAARALGLRTIYIARPQEEAWSEDDERYQATKAALDLWVGENEDGFRTMAAKLKEIRS